MGRFVVDVESENGAKERQPWERNISEEDEKEEVNRAQSSADMKVFKLSSSLGLVVRSFLHNVRDFDDKSVSAVVIGGDNEASCCTRAIWSLVPASTKLYNKVDGEEGKVVAIKLSPFVSFL